MNKAGKVNAVAVILISALAIAGLGYANQQGMINLNIGSGVPSGDGGGNGGDTTGLITGCAIDTTAPLTVLDEFDSSKELPAVKYTVNGGGVQTDTDGTISNLNKGDSLELLIAYNNASGYIATKETMDIDNCGANTETFSASPNTTVTLRCFNEEGNVISDPENETIGTGEAPTLRCELAGVAKTKFPYGGVITAEMSGTAYKENEVSITGLGSIPKEGITGDPVTQARSAYTLSASANKVVAVEVAPFEGAVVKTFYIYLPAEDSQNPSNSDDVTLYFYPNACYEEEDVPNGELRCGMTDLDNSFVMSSAGTTTIAVD